MDKHIVLQILLIVYLLLSMLANSHRPRLDKVKTAKINWPGGPLLLFYLIGTGISLYFIASGPHTLVHMYVRIIFCLLVVGHALWLGIDKSNVYKVIYLTLAFFIIFLRFTRPGVIIHDLMIMAALVWIGPLLVQTRVLTVKRFMIVSVILFFYDIFFVWLSPFASNVYKTSQLIEFPLGLTVGTNSIGMGDLIWANCLITLIRETSWKYFTISILVFSDLLLVLYVIFTRHVLFFPLLVLWAPIGLLILRTVARNYKSP